MVQSESITRAQHSAALNKMRFLSARERGSCVYSIPQIGIFSLWLSLVYHTTPTGRYQIATGIQSEHVPLFARLTHIASPCSWARGWGRSYLLTRNTRSREVWPSPPLKAWSCTVLSALSAPPHGPLQHPLALHSFPARGPCVCYSLCWAFSPSSPSPQPSPLAQNPLYTKDRISSTLFFITLIIHSNLHLYMSPLYCLYHQ